MLCGVDSQATRVVVAFGGQSTDQIRGALFRLVITLTSFPSGHHLSLPLSDAADASVRCIDYRRPYNGERWRGVNRIVVKVQQIPLDNSDGATTTMRRS